MERGGEPCLASCDADTATQAADTATQAADTATQAADTATQAAGLPAGDNKCSTTGTVPPAMRGVTRQPNVSCNFTASTGLSPE